MYFTLSSALFSASFVATEFSKWPPESFVWDPVSPGYERRWHLDFSEWAPFANSDIWWRRGPVRSDSTGEFKSLGARGAYHPCSFHTNCPVMLRNGRLPVLLKCDLPHDSTVTTAIIASPSGQRGGFCFVWVTFTTLLHHGLCGETISWFCARTCCSLPVASFC